MNKKLFPVFAGLFVISMILAACAQNPATAEQPTAVTSTATVVPVANTLWINPILPKAISTNVTDSANLSLVSDQEKANLILTLRKDPTASPDLLGSVAWVYALEAPFPTVTDELSLSDLQRIWKGTVEEEDPLNMLEVSQETKPLLDALWGNGSSQTVTVVPETQFETNDFTQPKTWAVVPFDQIAPRWKVISLDGLNPLDKPLDADKYALTVHFDLTAQAKSSPDSAVVKTLMQEIQTSNRDESKMTVLMMTGTTAITRAIAYKMEIKGLDYPIEMIKPLFANADLIHVSNEISFNPDCPYPDAYQHGLQFCASPKYLQTLKDLGVNVVELTGNHENDYGPENFVSTIQTYHDLGWAYYGGGKTPDEAKQPIKLEVNGNKIAFIGCNVAGPTSDWVTDDRAGTATCDMDYIHEQIKELKSEGYVVITTFQHYEVYVYMYGDLYAKDFQDAAAAGADIVNGSQAHYAMGMQFVNNSLIHYGLGNFLFDQMSYDVVGEKIRREFIDRHIIYNGKYINTQLKTALLTDWAQPVPMTEEERSSFLTDIFGGSKWK